MTFDFTCQACDASFELDLSDLLEDATVECPHCEARAPKAAVEAVTGALDELFAQLAALQRKFTVVFEVESDDLPPPHDREGGRSRESDDEDEEAPEGGEDEGWDEASAQAEEDDED